MGSEEVKSAITGWCNTDELQLVEDRSTPGNDLSLGLRAAAGGGGTVPVDVVLENGADRVTVRSGSGGGLGAQATRDLLDSRPALVSSDGGGVVGHVYLDGFTRQAFVTVVREVAKTSRLLGAGSGASAGEARDTGGTAAGAMLASGDSASQQLPGQTPSWSAQPASSQPYGQPQPVSPAAQQLPAPSFSRSEAAGGYAPLSGQPAQQAQPQAQQQPQPMGGGGFGPTHTVPPQGMQAWAAPDPTGAVVATLGGGLPIQVTEVRGAWARVLCSNGWTGWVDGRIIGVAR